MMNFRTVAVFIAVVGLIFGLAGLADAAHTKAHKKAAKAESGEPTTLPGRGPGLPEMILQGSVLAVDPRVGFIVMRHGAGRDAEEIPVETDNKTTLMRGGKKIGVDEVKVGDRVRVSYTGQPGDVSKMIDVMTGPPTRARRRA
jgi:hypothetical protein